MSAKTEKAVALDKVKAARIARVLKAVRAFSRLHHPVLRFEIRNDGRIPYFWYQNGSINELMHAAKCLNAINAHAQAKKGKRK